MSIVTRRRILAALPALAALPTLAALPAVVGRPSPAAAHPVGEPPILNFVGPQGWPPYYLAEGDPRGIAVDLLAELGRRTGLAFETRYIPVQRGRRLFEQGVLHLETLVASEWRDVPGLNAVALWTRPLMRGQLMVILPPGSNLPVANAQDLTGRLVATVAGYVHVPEPFERYAVANDREVLRAVASGRVDAGIMERNVLSWLLRETGEKVQVGPAVEEVDYRVMLHRARAHLFAPIDTALEEIRADGTLQAIVASWST